MNRKVEPFDWLDETVQGRVFLVLALLTAVMSVYFVVFMSSLRNEHVANGILSFEFASTAKEAARILRHWTASDKMRALFHLGLDYLYLFAYGLSFSLGIVLLRRKMKGLTWKLGWWLSWFALVAIPMDAIENYALLLHLLKGPTDTQAMVSVVCASIKFTAVGASVAYLLWGSLLLGSRSARKFFQL